MSLRLKYGKKRPSFLEILGLAFGLATPNVLCLWGYMISYGTKAGTVDLVFHPPTYGNRVASSCFKLLYKSRPEVSNIMPKRPTKLVLARAFTWDLSVVFVLNYPT